MPRANQSRKGGPSSVAGPAKKMGGCPSPESVAAILQLVQSIPEGDTEKDGQELEGRPAKRAKSTPSGHKTICVGRERLLLPDWQAAVNPKHIVVSRQNVGRHLSLKLTRARAPSKEWQLTLSSRRKSSATFQVSHTFPGRGLTDRQASALSVAEKCGFDSGDHGCLWTSIAVSIKQDGTSVQLEFTIVVNWNESLTVWGNSQLNTQQTIRNAVISTWYPAEGRLLALPQSSPSPQDFYEAAYVPDKEAFDADVSSLRVPHLEASLFPFQRRAVQWLLRREGVQWRMGIDGSNGGIHQYLTPDEELPLSFTAFRDADNGEFYLSSALGVATRDTLPFRSMQNIRGGILAEEMGLGKTLEVIGLMLLHKRPEGPAMVHDPSLGREILATSATLIVCPSSLLDQWISELGRHAPSLKVLYYPGLKKASKNKHDIQISAEYMDEHDVVITTYEVLRTEIWIATDEVVRSMRNARRYERPTSPLVQLSWWRVCIDEAQMVENWTNNAAKLARMIPRVNAWAITGTPVKDDIQKDLRGLLNFLRYEPYASDSKIWNLVTTKYKASFRSIIEMISMRHTKSLVRNEISIPPQRRYVITMPFTAVEEQHYQNLFEELAASCGLNTLGDPTSDGWDPEDPAVQNAMRTALDRLRQTALHPDVGNRNRRALGHRTAPMRTVTEVLDAMLEQSDGARRTEHRNLLSLRITKGQILAGLHQVTEAMAIWEDVREKSTAIVHECRERLEKEIKDAREKVSEETRASSDDHDGDGHEDNVSQQVGEARRRLRSALEIQHRAVFFCANGYFSIKSNEEVTTPDSDEFRRLEKLEIEGYDFAKLIRKEILQESYSKAKGLMGRLEDAARKQNFAVIPESTPSDLKGIESRPIVDALQEIYGALNDQANQLDEWRERVIQMLLKPLVDEENEEITGEEYEESTKLQDEILVFVQVLRATVADRLTTVSGQRNNLVAHEATTAIRLAKECEGPSPAKLIELFRIKDELKYQFSEHDPLTSLKGVISELRGLSVRLGHDAATGGRAAELAIIRNLLKITQRQQAEQAKAATAMEQEIERFTETLNARMDFYRQLQAVSDMVGEYDGSIDDAALGLATRQEEALQTKLATSESKHRYLVHLKEAESGSDEQRLCIICQSTFSIGVLTVCGHQFCKECIGLWFRAHRNCPLCKRHLRNSDLHDIVLKPQELRIHSEGNQRDINQSQTTPTKKISTIYSEFNPEKLAEIKNMDLQGPNFTTKVDTMVRHLVWLRESDPGAKSIVFSQYKDFLDVLGQAFRRYRIGYTSFEKAHGITQFKEDPATEVFLLHARAHASGLNLVNASHVFLCEPLLNTALELQAIARVDRIGQQQETTVWLYIVDGTVEESIYNLSVERRMEHMGRNLLHGKSKESTPELLDVSLDAANTMEMQQAHLSKLMGKDGISGEAVDKKDLWTCLFGHLKGGGRNEEHLLANPVTRGFLAAEAAEERRGAAGPAV